MEQANNIGNLVMALVVLVGLFFTVGKPINKLTNTITAFEVNLKNMVKDLNEHKNKNTKSHERIWDELDEHSDKIQQLDVRVSKFEK